MTMMLILLLFKKTMTRQSNRMAMTPQQMKQLLTKMMLRCWWRVSNLNKLPQVEMTNRVSIVELLNNCTLNMKVHVFLLLRC